MFVREGALSDVVQRLSDLESVAAVALVGSAAGAEDITASGGWRAYLATVPG